jgi:hypothetical protein
MKYRPTGMAPTALREEAVHVAPVLQENNRSVMMSPTRPTVIMASTAPSPTMMIAMAMAAFDINDIAIRLWRRRGGDRHRGAWERQSDQTEGSCSNQQTFHPGFLIGALAQMPTRRLLQCSGSGKRCHWNLSRGRNVSCWQRAAPVGSRFAGAATLLAAVSGRTRIIGKKQKQPVARVPACAVAS